MNQPDYLNMRTTNINIRISPLLKSALIEKGAEMGINLSDFINHLLTKEMSGRDESSEKISKLNIIIKELRDEILRYESLAEPFKEAIGDILTKGEERVPIRSRYDILKFIAESFKPRK